MLGRRGKKHEARILLVTWVALVASTGGSFWLSEAGPSTASGVGTAGWVIGFAALKSLLIALVFMEMRHGPRVWTSLTGLFLLSEAALLVAVLS